MWEPPLDSHSDRMDGAKFLPDCGWLNLSVADSRCSATAVGSEGWTRGSLPQQCTPKIELYSWPLGYNFWWFQINTEGSEGDFSMFQAHAWPICGPLLAMKPRFHHAMPAVGDAVVVQGLPACQGFNGRRSRRGSSGAEAVAWWAYPPGYFMNLGHVFCWELWGRLWLWALRFQLWGLWCDHEFLFVAFCSSIAGEWMFIMFILPNMV